MSKGMRILIVLGNLVAACGVYLWFFGAATMFVLETRYVSWKAPAVKKEPLELTDLSVATATSRKLSFGGYEFDVPWDDVDEGKTKIVGKMEVIVFHSGNAMLVSTPPPKEFVNGILKSGFDEESFRRIYGDEPLRSDYAMYRLMLQTTPEKITLLTPRREAVGRMMMLTIKAIAMPDGANTGLFAIRNQNLHGFQYGDPRKRAPRIVVDLLDDDGGIEFNIGQRKEGTSPAITQAELNAIIQSTRRVRAQGSD